jgi:putative membrane protein
MKNLGIPALVLVAAMAVACQRTDRADSAKPADSTAVGTAGAADLSRADKDFVEDVAIANMAEIELGRMAADRATNADVKKYAQMLVDDHTTAGEKLKSAVEKHRITLPTAIDDKHRDLLETLSKKQGADFDRDFIDAMVDGHEDLLDKLASRVDEAKLGEWRTKYEDRLANRKTEEKAEAITVAPERSDNAVTMTVNQWAADTYPSVYAHLHAAKALDDKIKKRTTP